MSEPIVVTDADQVNAIAWTLMAAFYKAEPNSNITKHPVSFVATFADMARAVVSEHRARSTASLEAENARLREALQPFADAYALGGLFNSNSPRYEAAAKALAIGDGS